MSFCFLKVPIEDVAFADNNVALTKTVRNNCAAVEKLAKATETVILWK